MSGVGTLRDGGFADRQLTGARPAAWIGTSSTRGLTVLSPRSRRGVAGIRGKLVIGLAGGIGAGKSTVARLFGELGAVVIDSDQLNHEELDDPAVIETLVEWFGQRLRGPDGRIRRAALAEVVFGDAGQRARVEALLHPRIERRRRGLIESYRRDPDVRAIVIDSPLLFESGLDRLCDAVVFVEASAAERHGRVAAARGWTEGEVARREKSQKPLDNKKNQADHVIVNNSGLDDLHADVEVLLSELLAQGSDS